jgi:hypothetical protein
VRVTQSIVIALAATAAVTACISSTAPDPANQVHTAIRGFIVDQNGDGVGAPLVSITILGSPSGGSAKLLASTQLVPDDAGRFVVTFSINDEVPQTGYAALSVTPAPGTGLAGRDTSGIPVQLQRGFPPVDTTVVTVALQPR